MNLGLYSGKELSAHLGTNSEDNIFINGMLKKLKTFFFVDVTIDVVVINDAVIECTFCNCSSD